MMKQNKNRNNRTKLRSRRLQRVRNGITQNGAGTSHQDSVSQVRKFQIFSTLPFENASSDYAFGLMNFNIQGNESPFKPILKAYGGLYEQYRVKRVRIRAQVGKGYNNDKRLQTIVGARVDVDRQPQNVTIQNVQQVNCSENTVIRTFTEKGNILLADYRPQCRDATTASLPILPNSLQFYPITDADSHTWKGTTATCMIPDPSIAANSLAITLIAEVDVEFRGRITNQVVFPNNSINQGPI